jgi:4-hydroxybenzoate polyprenyltransferase
MSIIPFSEENMMRMETNNRGFAYLRLLRPHGAAATGVVGVIGALIMGLRNPLLLSLLFLVGVLVHFFLFVLNEYADVFVDSHSRDLQKKPLVSGVITKRQALGIAVISVVGAYSLIAVFFSSLYPFVFFSLTVLSAIIYDLFGKKIPLGDLFVAGTCFFFCFFGASTVSIHFSPLVVIVSCVMFFHILFNNTVEGGLKDADHDFLAGAKTTVARLGVKVHEGKLMITPQFTAFSYGVKLTYIALIIFAGFQPELNLWSSGYYLIYGVILLLVVVIFVTLYRFWHPLVFDRQRLIKIFGSHEIASYFLGPIILVPMLGYGLVLLLLLLPVGWFMVWNLILYGKPMQPQV